MNRKMTDVRANNITGLHGHVIQRTRHGSRPYAARIATRDSHNDCMNVRLSYQSEQRESAISRKVLKMNEITFRCFSVRRKWARTGGVAEWVVGRMNRLTHSVLNAHLTHAVAPTSNVSKAIRSGNAQS